jgi:tRNA threonylcarbamoyladenosine biosynthesis protein TsaB
VIALGLDTSSMAGSVAVASSDGSLEAQLSVSAGMTHSERLLPAVHSLLEASGLRMDRVDLFSVAAGPGSFTGLRIGMATAKGLALACARPLTGFSTLRALAAACAPWAGREPVRPIAVLMDAGRGELYRGLYEVRRDLAVSTLADDAATSPEAAVASMPRVAEGPWLVCGDGLKTYGDRLAPLLPAGSVRMEDPPPISLTLARLALEAVHRKGMEGLPVLTPHYLRVSDAERTWRG